MRPQHKIHMESKMAARLVPKLYLIGDSNTQMSLDGGFSSKLSCEYARRCDVVNRGYSGYTSRHICVMLPKMLENDNRPKGVIDTAVILLGTNDANILPDARHVPLDIFKNNIEFIVSLLKKEGVKNIILISPPPCDEKKWRDFLKQSKGVESTMLNSNVEIYADVCMQVATEQKILFINLYKDIMSLMNWESYFYDGLHFNVNGNNVLFYKLKAILDNIIPEQMVYPEWNKIDENHPELALS